MARISRNALRKAILTHLKADAAVTALVPAERIYPPRRPDRPAWPFGAYGVASDVPLRASCVDGSQIIFALHGFHPGPGDEGADAIGAAFAQSLDGAAFALTVPHEAKVTIRYTGGQVIADGDEADAWHAIANFRATIIS